MTESEKILTGKEILKELATLADRAYTRFGFIINEIEKIKNRLVVLEKETGID